MAAPVWRLQPKFFGRSVSPGGQRDHSRRVTSAPLDICPVARFGNLIWPPYKAESGSGIKRPGPDKHLCNKGRGGIRVKGLAISYEPSIWVFALVVVILGERAKGTDSAPR